MDLQNYLVTPIPSFGKQKVSEFYDKADLIRCCMASVHLVRTQPRFDKDILDSNVDSAHSAFTFLAF